MTWRIRNLYSRAFGKEAKYRRFFERSKREGEIKDILEAAKEGRDKVLADLSLNFSRKLYNLAESMNNGLSNGTFRRYVEKYAPEILDFITFPKSF